MEDFIQFNKSNIINIGIKDEKGNILNGKLTFDLEDVELPLRYQEMLELHKRNQNDLQHQFIIIDKKKDYKGKKLLTPNTEAKLKALLDYYKKDMKALDLFLGEGKTQMILDLMGRKPYYTMFDDFGEMLKPIIPVFERNLDTIDQIITEKYSMEEENALE